MWLPRILCFQSATPLLDCCFRKAINFTVTPTTLITQFTDSLSSVTTQSGCVFVFRFQPQDKMHPVIFSAIHYMDYNYLKSNGDRKSIEKHFSGISAYEPISYHVGGQCGRTQSLSGRSLSGTPHNVHIYFSRMSHINLYITYTFFSNSPRYEKAAVWLHEHVSHVRFECWVFGAHIADRRQSQRPKQLRVCGDSAFVRAARFVFVLLGAPMCGCGPLKFVLIPYRKQPNYPNTLSDH